MALNEETEAVFKSSRTDVDPVSGNEVPPGSLPKEVRDDIPAQLSEGEYVVPADVLRFYGMKFFEDLRKQAKIELERMDRDGRIGGEPIAVMEISELSPEEMQELDAIGAAVGGFITQQPTQSTQADPYQQQQMMYRQGAPVAVGNAGYDEGGDVTQPTYTTEDLLNQFGPGFSFTDTSSNVEYSTVTLYGPGGDMITLTLPTQQDLYDQKIAEGYTTQQVALTTATSVGADRTSDEGEPVQYRPSRQQEGLDIDSIKDEDLLKTANGLGLMTNIGSAIAANAGLPLGAIVNVSMAAQYNDLIDRMDKAGIEHDLTKKGSMFGGEGSLYENLTDISGDNNVNFGDTWLGDLLGFDGETGVQGPGLKESWKGARRGGDDDTPTPAPKSTDKNDKTPSGTTYAQGESPLEKQIAAEVEAVQTEDDYVTSASAG